jgi:hypothetical protein
MYSRYNFLRIKNTLICAKVKKKIPIVVATGIFFYPVIFYWAG